MAKVWTYKVVGGAMFMSDHNRADLHEWLKMNEGKLLRLEPEKAPVSAEVRGYYFGAVIPLIKSTCEEWADLSPDKMHEVIKKLFFYFESWNPRTKRVERFGRSVMSENDWNSTKKAMQFLDIISDYLAQCGLTMPDPEEYKRFRDTLGETPKVEYPSEQALADKF